MRELLFKSMSSEDKKRRLLSLAETNQQGEWITRTERKSSFVIREEVAKEDEITLKRWVVSHWNQQPEHLRKTSVILKERDTISKTGRYLSKSHGILYALGNGKAYTIGFAQVVHVRYGKNKLSPSFDNPIKTNLQEKDE